MKDVTWVTGGDFTRTTTYDETRERVRETDYRAFTFPVAVEFNVKESLRLRLGAIHTEYVSDQTRTDTEVEFSASRVQTSYGDGTSSDVLSSNSSDQVPVTSEVRESRSSSTNYVYGMVDLETWRLSAILRW